jgi:vacuolar iron transporter family protein
MQSAAPRRSASRRRPRPAWRSGDPELAPDRDVSGGWLRPAVFGAVDGLVTNASLISGPGGGGATVDTVVLTGVAALVAGVFSTGTGEYISVTNQNELVHSEVSLERQMLSRFPAAEQEELAGYFRRYGADPDTAARMAAAVSADPGTALRSGLRQLALGGLAIAVTFGVGHLIGSHGA